MEYEIIDIDQWKRKQHYQIFKEYQNPRYDISFELDITNFYHKIKMQNLSFTLAFIYSIAEAANGIEEFRYRFEDGNVVIYNKINLSFAYLNRETELFKNVVVEYKSNMNEFVTYAKDIAKNQKEYFTGPMGNNVYQFSSIPWISFTHISHTNSGKKNNATPMFVWGKYYDKGEKLMLPFSIEAHHSFVDGIHMGKLAENLQLFLNEY